MTSSSERLKQLENMEAEIANVVQLSGRAISEMGKEKPNQTHVENYTKSFLSSLTTVEKRLAEQINYLSQVATGQPHEGSSYSAQKDAQMSIHRKEHAKSKLNELKMTCAQSL